MQNSYKKLQNILFRKFITAWRNGNWQNLSAKQIWNEIFWECQTKHGIKPQVLIKEFKTTPYALPPALLVSLRETEKHYQEEQIRKSSTTKNLINMADEKKLVKDINQSANTDSREMIPVWILYAILSGTTAMGFWVLAHECGHGAFSKNKTLETSIGYVLHSILLVPYFSWQRSHSIHHRFTNHITKAVQGRTFEVLSFRALLQVRPTSIFIADALVSKYRRSSRK